MIKWLKQLFLGRGRPRALKLGHITETAGVHHYHYIPESLEYVTTSSGFRYRILDTSIEAGYDARGRPSASLVNSLRNDARRAPGDGQAGSRPHGEQGDLGLGRAQIALQGWSFQLAAGIPVTRRTPVLR
jgi:hypothetical protein